MKLKINSGRRKKRLTPEYAQSEEKSGGSGRELFESLAIFYASAKLRIDRVTMFGFDCLRNNGKVFAKLHGRDLVIKLPVNRIAALTASGHLRAYARGEGRTMREWAVIVPLHGLDVQALAEESRVFTEV